MSLSIDGVWKAGVWNTTVWHSGVWQEGATTPAPSGGGRIYSNYENEWEKKRKKKELTRREEAELKRLLIAAIEEDTKKAQKELETTIRRRYAEMVFWNDIMDVIRSVEKHLRAKERAYLISKQELEKYLDDLEEEEEIMMILMSE